MKNKILLSTLLGGALLAACTADDVLDVKEVAGGVNPAAPVFTVSFDGGENDLTRATMPTTGTQRPLGFNPTDKMSLYHGGGNVDYTKETISKWDEESHFLQSGGDISRVNAIYSSVEETENGEKVRKFKTQAMVNAGAAIMIFPADTTFANRGNQDPHISVKNVQTKETKNLTPYVSEVLAIAPWDAFGYDSSGDPIKGSNTAGFGRVYDISLRRIGGQLKLALNGVNGSRLNDLTNATGETIDKIAYKTVKMEVDGKSGDNSTYPFTTEMSVKIGKERNKTITSTKVTTELGGDNTAHPDWNWTPWMQAVEKKNTITTYDMGEDEKSAIFTLLPADDEKDKVFSSTQKMEIENSVNNLKFEFDKPLFENMTITVATSYGKVEIKDQNKKVWNAGTGWDLTMVEGLGEMLFAAFHPQDDWKNRNDVEQIVDEKYRGQVMANYADRTLEVDLSTLDMNGLHVIDQKNLLDAIAVHNALVPNSSVLFILDGAEEGKPNPGKFTLDATGWATVEKIMKDPNSKIKFALCASTENPDEVCSAVVLDNGTAKAVEVPELAFEVQTGTGSNFTTLADPVQADVQVELVGKWEYANGKVPENGTTRSKYMTGVKYLDVTAGSELELKNQVLANNEGLTIRVNEKTATKEYGLVSVKSDVRVGVNVLNKGKVAISENSSLIMNEKKEFTNESGTPTDYENGNVLLEYGGLLYNNGRLGIEDQSEAKINNYGTIKAMSEKARIYISTNSLNPDGEDALGKKYNGATNKIGTIILSEKTGGDNNTRVSDTNRQGFIKLQVNAVNATGADFGGVANYIVLGEGVRTYTDADNVKYVEINVEANEEVKFVNEIGADGKAIPAKLFGLFVNPTRNANVPDGVEVRVSVRTYLPGKVWKAGTFVAGNKVGDTKSEYISYFGGDEEHYKNVTVY